MIRIFLVAALIVAAMATVKDGRLLKHAGLLGSCALVAPSTDGGEWWACRDGKVSDAPDLSLKSCTRYGARGGREYWHCPAAVAASRGAG